MAGEGGAAPDVETAAKPKSELFLRVVSAIVLALGAIGSAWWGGAVFVLVWVGVFVATALEWAAILRNKAECARRWWIVGLFYAVLPALAVILLRNSPVFGLTAIFFLFAVVWGADVGAYFAGRTFGGPKLAPSISPKKTWSGLIGGLITATLAGLLLLHLMGMSLKPMHAFLAIVLALASAAGDLFESGFKRKFGVKDSGHLIPGHGGFMDRLDGFIFAASLAAAIGIALGGIGDSASGLLAGW